MCISFPGAFVFNTPYLSLILLTFPMLMGHSMNINAIGIVVDHVHYFLEYVCPTVVKIWSWWMEKLVEPLKITKTCFVVYTINTQ